jgi:hypothetical protein
VLDHAPTTPVISTVLAGGLHRYGDWLSGTVELVALLLGSLWAGQRACAWALRRPGDGGRFRESRAHRRRAGRRTPLAALVRVEQANVWRAAPLRRGLLVLTLLPGAVAAGAGLRWDSLVLIPGLVAAGAGLLYGVNVFCLDGGGATWLASLPHLPRVAIVAKTVVLAETIGGSCALAALAGGLRAGLPSLAELLAMIGSVVTCSMIVLATCLRLSLRRPGRADLRGSRDTPAPPAAMAVYSVRLATLTTLVGLVFSIAAHRGQWLPSVVLTGALAVISGVAIMGVIRRWDDPAVRSRVVAAIAYG